MKIKMLWTGTSEFIYNGVKKQTSQSWYNQIIKQIKDKTKNRENIDLYWVGEENGEESVSKIAKIYYLTYICSWKLKILSYFMLYIRWKDKGEKKQAIETAFEGSQL